MAIALVVLIVVITFAAPWWLKLILTGINMFVLPDAVPFVDEFLQLYNTFNNLPLIRGIKGARTARKVKKIISD